jgi:hypothetical protein
MTGPTFAPKNGPYDWEDDAKGSWEVAVAAQREQWLVENLPAPDREREDV